MLAEISGVGNILVRKCLARKISGWEISDLGNVLVGKYPVGEISSRGNVRVEKYLVGEISGSGNTLVGKCLVGEVSDKESVCRESVNRRSVLWKVSGRQTVLQSEFSLICNSPDSVENGFLIKKMVSSGENLDKRENLIT